MKGDGDPGERRRRPGDVRVHRTPRGRLLRYAYGVMTALPAAPVFLDQTQHRVGLDVPGHDDRRVLRPIPTLEELMRIVELVGHVLDVFQESHRRMPVGMGREGMVVLDFLDLDLRVGAVLVVLPEDRPRLGLERHRVVSEVLEPVGLHPEHQFEIFLGERRVVVGVVIRRVGVLPRADFGQNLLILLGRIELRAAEHHVLEQMREPGLAGFDFISRTGLHRDLKRDDVGKAGRHDDDLQAVRERCLRGLERKNIASSARRGGGLRFLVGSTLRRHCRQRGQAKQGEREGANVRHAVSFRFIREGHSISRIAS